jgi:hypothetical protein
MLAFAWCMAKWVLARDEGTPDMMEVSYFSLYIHMYVFMGVCMYLCMHGCWPVRGVWQNGCLHAMKAHLT